MGCIFCDIFSGKIPAKKVYENDKIMAFEDIKPAAPVHILVIHKNHFSNINELTAENASVMQDLFLGVKEVVSLKNLSDPGYRIIINNGPAAGQEVFHLHIHILAGKENLGPMLS